MINHESYSRYPTITITNTLTRLTFLFLWHVLNDLTNLTLQKHCNTHTYTHTQWRHVMTEASSSSVESADRLLTEDGTEVDHFSDQPNESEASLLPEGLMFQPGGGDECGAVKPWLGAVRTPKQPPNCDPSQPSVRIRVYL